MKTSLFATLAATVLLTATSAFAAPAPSQQGPGRPPVAYQGPADYDYHDRDADHGRGYDQLPDYRDQRRGADRRYDQREASRYDRGPSYGPGYGQPLPPQPLPQPRRPMAVAIQIQL